ncbi:MAG: type I methionyl aminopeptidase [Acidobacteriota bacterium]
MISIKTAAELASMERANQIVLSILAELSGMIAPGVDIADLDAYAAERTQQEGARSAFKGYHGFPATLCVSVNEQVVHGIPTHRLLRDGDIVSIDFGVFVDGLCGDGAQTFPVGQIPEGCRLLIERIEKALAAGIAQMRPGQRTGDVGRAVQEVGEAHGYGIVRDFVGHGIGRKMHEKPQLPNYGEPGRGVRLEEGMVLAIEPMLNLGTGEVVVAADQWTVSTADSQPSAHIERSVAITAEGPWVLGISGRPGVVDTALPPAGEAVRSATVGGTAGRPA